MGRLSWKLILLGGLASYVAQWIVSMATGPLIHEGVLKDLYDQTSSFWRPELVQEPPDMAALMPRWILTGILGSFVFAGVYNVVRTAFAGAGWKKGLKYGLAVALLACTWHGGWSGIFDLPDIIWVWWALEGFLYYAVGGAVLGWVGAKLAPEPV